MHQTEGWQKVFQFITSHEAGFSEIYADSCSRTEFTIATKNSRIRSFLTGGTQLVVQGSSGTKTYLSNINHPGAFLDWLKKENLSIPQYSFPIEERQEISITDKNKLLEQACRRTLLEQPEIKEYKVTYTEEVKNFVVASPDHPPKFGKESSGFLNFEFDAGNGIKHRHFRVKKGRTEIPALLADLEGKWLPRFKLEKALQQPWPTPSGKLPVFWSSSVLSQLLLCLIRFITAQKNHEESQSFLKNSFSGFRFQLIDNWKEADRVDAEGRTRAATLLIDGGEVPQLLTHQTSGFSRRRTHRDYPVTAPWEPALFGIEREKNLLKNLTHGLSVHEIDILNFDPLSAKVGIRIVEASLIHQGIEGEHVEPFQLELSLLDLFRTFQLFSEESTPHPLTWYQAGQELFVETTVPDALSPSLEICGSVPGSYYW